MSSLVFDTIKILLTAIIIFAVAQLSQRDTFLAAILASIPLVSVLAMTVSYTHLRAHET